MSEKDELDVQKKVHALAWSSMGIMAPKLLLFGVIIGLLGFVLVVAVLVSCEVEAWRHQTAYAECADYQPVPLTVSELVNRFDSVCGRIFFGLELLAGLSIYISGYGYCLNNCSCDCHVLCARLDIRWSDVRQFVPPVGLLLLCLIPTVPLNQITGFHDCLIMVCHFLAAGSLVLGTTACEYHFITRHGSGGESAGLLRPPRIGRGEKWTRIVLSGATVACFGLFGGANVLVWHEDCMKAQFITTEDCSDTKCFPVMTQPLCEDAMNMFLYSVYAKTRLERVWSGGEAVVGQEECVPPKCIRPPGCFLDVTDESATFVWSTPGLVATDRSPAAGRVCTCGPTQVADHDPQDTWSRKMARKIRQPKKEATEVSPPVRRAIAMAAGDVQVWNRLQSGPCEALTVCSFVGEVLAGICVLLLMMVIWYNSPERHALQACRVNTREHEELGA